jgi:putative toxin-antitoxin system antitoxin component (TIGR02293 family)
MDISRETLAAVEAVFGTAHKAAAWLRRPCAALNDRVPLDLVRTVEGRQDVEILLGRIAHGIAA